MLLRIRIALSLLSSLGLLLSFGCGTMSFQQSSEGKLKEVPAAQSVSSDYQRIVEGISSIVGKQLDLNASEIEVDVPLTKQKKPADELDVVEIVMSVEEAFKIEIKDEEVGEHLDDVSRTLSIRKLADIVAKKKS